MAVRLQYHRTCDRCSDPFEEQVASSAQDLPTRKPLKLRLTSGTITLFDWDDLCPSCEKAVDNLVDRLRLSPKKTSTTAEVLTESSPSENTPY